LVLELELDSELGVGCDCVRHVEDEEVEKEMSKALCRRGGGWRLRCRLRGGNLEHVAADSDSDSDSCSEVCSEAASEAEVWVWV
jgi:hypothetical protein